MFPEISAAPGVLSPGSHDSRRGFPTPKILTPGSATLRVTLIAAILACGASHASAIRFFKRSDAREKAKPAESAPATKAAEKPAEEKKFRFPFRSSKGSGEPAKKSKASSSSKTHRLGFLNRKVPIAAALAPLPTDTAYIVQAQIYLDGERFGPGKIDGTLGEFTVKAVEYYNRTHGIEPGNWGPLLYHAGEAVPQIHRTYVVRAEDFNYVGSLPYDPPAQATKKYMSYRSVREFVSERFHTDENYLRRANGGRSLSNLKVGDTVIVPNVAPFRIEDVKKNQRFDRADTLSARHVVVNTDEKVALIMQDGKLVAVFPITPGQERYIPYGNWKIDTMVTTPTFRYDKQMLQEGVRGDVYHMLPPGPNSPVGIFWAGLTKSGIGLHGTNNPDTIGRARSSGCIRLANWDAVRLSSLVRPGATVEVR